MGGTQYGFTMDDQRSSTQMHFTQFKMPQLLNKLEGNKSQSVGGAYTWSMNQGQGKIVPG